MTNEVTEFDGVLQADFKLEDGAIGRRLSSPHRQGILKQNRELQRNVGALRPMESMGCELMIPEPDYYMLLELLPDLKCPDSGIRTRAWHKFLASSASDPYRTTPRHRKNGLSAAISSNLVGQL